MSWAKSGTLWVLSLQSADIHPSTPVLQTYPFGWEPDADGFRGQVFATPDNSTVIVSVKGTSAGLLGGGGPTVKKDKLNDNLLFSCCCARVDWTWTTVCGCYRGGWKCDQGATTGCNLERVKLRAPIIQNVSKLS